MVKKLFTLIFALSATATMALAQAPAFPGAEGHGRFTTGGRGGNVIHVTNLNDNGAGSFRQAVSGSTKKIIVFDVGGVIPLASDLTIGDNTTIEGQTAPWPGITLRYYTVQPGGNNIIRFIRFRRGQEKDINDGADASWQRYKTGIIFDHCSFSWSIDEVASFYDNNNFTMQWCTVAESLTNPGHSKGAHGYGGIWGGKLVSFHHNMLAHLYNRGPRFNGARYGWTGYTNNKDYSTYKWASPTQAENVDFRNCVMYDAQGTCYGGPGGGQVNMVNNFYKAGPSYALSKTTVDGKEVSVSSGKERGNQERITIVTVSTADNSDKDHPEYYGMTCRYYITGNTTMTTSAVKTENKDWAGVNYDSGVHYYNGGVYSEDKNNLYGDAVEHTTVDGVSCVNIKLDNPAPTGSITTHTADNAFTKVIAYAGASLNRDDVDTRYAREAQNGTCEYTGSVTKSPGLVDLVSDVKGYTEDNFGTGSRADDYDTDQDGMPDEWETKWGLNPNNATDAKAYTMDTLGYYTNLEMYCNSLVEEIMKGEVADGTANYEEYWPVVKAIEPSKPGEKVSLELSQGTYTSSDPTTTWKFSSNDYTVTVTNTASKTYQTGKDNTVKYSNGKQFTINLPEGISITEATFYGYDNYNGADSYVSELNGTTFDATKYTFPQKDASGNYFLTTQTIPTSATGTLTFTLGANQTCLIITLNGEKVAAKKGDENGDGNVDIIDINKFIHEVCNNITPTYDIKTIIDVICGQ